jgi:hypothetical protein
MYALLGDPATRLRLPEPLEVSVEQTATGWRWCAVKPPHAIHLEVGYRAARPLATTPPRQPTDAKEAGKAFAAANACLAFAAQPSPPDGGPWEGTWDRPGCLRLVATGPGAFYAAAINLSRDRVHQAAGSDTGQ